MIFPMRRYGYNITEVFLSSTGNIFAISMIVGAAALYITAPKIGISSLSGGVLIFAVFTSGLLLGLGSGGIRQNRPTMNLGLRLTLLTGIVWGIFAIVNQILFSGIISIVLIIMYVACILARREAVSARFVPRFFSLRQFETMIAVADVMIDDEEKKLHPIEIALRADHLLARMHSPAAKKDIRRVLFLLEWILPLMAFRPFPFSELGTHERRRVVKKIIWSRGIFKDIARTLKLLSTFPYYTDPSVRSAIGYIEFDDRKRAMDVDQLPKTHQRV